MMAIDEITEDRTAARTVLRQLALKANGLSGADIERLVREARQKARREGRSIAFADIIAILDAARPEIPEQLRWRMAVHESGHAIARLALGLGNILLTTIDSPNGGYVESTMPELEAGTEPMARSILIVRLAGRAAEEEMLSSVSAGSGGTSESDLAKSTELALAMETALGFARQWPLLYRSVEDYSSLLAYNPLLAERVNARLEEAYDAARDLIRLNRAALLVLVRALMKQHTLEGPELEAVLARVRKLMVGPSTHKARQPEQEKEPSHRT